MVTRMSGLASGMDIDSIVAKLMSAEKAPLNKLYQNKQKYEWQRDAYRDVNKQLKAFDSYLFDNMTMKKDMYKTTVNTTNSAVSATALAGTKGTFNISSVKQLAENANAVGKIGENTSATTALKDANLGFVFDANGEAKVNMKVLQADGEMKAVNLTFKSTDTISDVVTKLKKDTGLNAFYDEKSGQLSIATQATGKGKMMTGSEITTSYEENPLTGISEEIQKVGPKSDIASIFVEDLKEGEVGGKDFFAALGFNGGNFLGANGKNAEFTVNGAQIERQSNTFELDGFNITLNDEYTSAKPITLTAVTDVDNMVDKIKKFVETYNGLVESFTTSSKEKKNRDYAPLTDEQKEDMTEDQIKVWEEKAKSGILRGDSILQSGLTSMRSTMYSKGGSSNDLMDTLYKMGITTSSKTSDNGKLEINEEKLRAAIEKDPDAVFSTFSNSSDDSPGLVQKLRKNISTMTINIEKKAGKADSVNNTFNLGRSLNDVETRILNWKTKLADIETRYFKQFTAMETAINKANQQSSLFTTTQ